LTLHFFLSMWLLLSSVLMAGAWADPLCTGNITDQNRKKACQALNEALRSGCTKDVIDDIAKKYEQGMRGNPKAEPIAGMNQFCPNYGNLFNGDDTYRQLFFQQFVAALITEESGYDPNADDNGKSRGMMQIHPDQAKAPKYACACKDVVHGGTKGKGQQEGTGIFSVAANVKCGAHIALVDLRDDMSMGSGSVRAKTAKGPAKNYGPFGDSQAKKRSRMASKTSAYCVARGGKQNHSPRARMATRTPGTNASR
jgi:putative hemolysin